VQGGVQAADGNAEAPLQRFQAVTDGEVQTDGGTMSEDLFRSYARSFEQRREAEMSLQDFLTLCRDEPDGLRHRA
jgi:hypothetical protein